MNEEQVRKLVREFWARVDGGGCDNCTSDAVEALIAVFPEWEAVANAEHDAIWDEREGEQETEFVT